MNHTRGFVKLGEDDFFRDSAPVSDNEGQHEVDWSQQVFVEEEEMRPTVSLEFKDYVALFIASLQTVMLPIVILILFLFSIGLFFGLKSSGWIP